MRIAAIKKLTRRAGILGPAIIALAIVAVIVWAFRAALQSLMPARRFPLPWSAVKRRTSFASVFVLAGVAAVRLSVQ